MDGSPGRGVPRRRSASRSLRRCWRARTRSSNGDGGRPAPRRAGVAWSSGRAYDGGPRAHDGRVPLFQDFDQGYGVDQAIGQDEVPVPGDRGVADDVAAAGNGPRLELLRLGVETHDSVWRGSRLAVPDDVVDCGHPIRLRFRTTRR